jgi:opacity protein-like surface antigen
MSTTLRTTILFALTLLLTTTAWSQSSRPYNDKPNSLRLSYGDFTPDGRSVYWRTRERDFFGSAKDFEDDRFGATVSRTVSERWGYLFNGHVWEGQQSTSFRDRDYIDDQGDDIFHTATVEVIDFGAGVVFYPLRRNAIVAPYIAGGFALYLYDLREAGDFIDFETDGLEIFTGAFRDSGETVGWFWTVGLEIPIGPAFAVFGEYNWTYASTKLEGDFREFGTFDLGGEGLALGLSFRF